MAIHRNSSAYNTPLWLKAATGIILFVFFQIGYFWAEAFEGGVNGATCVDAWIPLWPVFIIFYMLGYLFVFLPFLLLRDRTAFYRAACVAWLMLVAAFVCFSLFPVYMDKPLAGGDDALSRLTRFHQKQDTRYNNFPSLHVALNVYALLLIWNTRRRLAQGLLPLCALVAVSTLFVKQHLVVDVAGGLALAAAGAWLYRRSATVEARRVELAFGAVMALCLLAIYLGREYLGFIIKVVQIFSARTAQAFAGAPAAWVIGAAVVLAGVVAWRRARR